MKLDLTKLPVLEAIVGFLVLSLVVTFVLAFMATEGAPEKVVAGSPTPSSGASATPPGSLSVSLLDNKFGQDQLKIGVGATVTFAISNDGSATHNMRIAGPDGEYNNDDDAVSDPEIISGGGTATLAWTAPESPGEIPFQCDFHIAQMKGTITVE